MSCVNTTLVSVVFSSLFAQAASFFPDESGWLYRRLQEGVCDRMSA